ncbi:MAG: AAA domain-containing protein, partial [Syntrophobacteraceae bacterium]
MSVAKDRLLSLFEFAKHAALLRSKPAAAITQHRLFDLHEHEIQGLPGIHVNVSDADSEDELWFSIERLHETRPPEITSKFLRPWVQIGQSPTEEPRLLGSTNGTSLIAESTHCSSANAPEQGKPQIDPDSTILLSEYERVAQVRGEFETYLNTRWLPWAKEEKLRRKSIAIYSKLFTLKQQLEGGIIEAQLELVWGVGVGIWNHNGTDVLYPLIGRPVELSLNSQTAEVELRPRDIDARLEIDWYASIGNPGVTDLEKTAKEFFGKAKTTFSPFDRGTFEPLLRTAATDLDVNGIYWPNEVSAEDRRLPRPDDNLKVTDTWVIFARPRTNSLFLQDLEKLRTQAEDTDIFPPAVAAVVTDPDTTNPVVELPSFRGLSASYHAEPSMGVKEARDIYFPKPFNDEQVRIIQSLEVSPGVVVQGPPGTGKTHTIANIICHYLAEGKRVLVTSMKDPALAVLREQLPDEIRPLAISLLTSEQEGMKQFEHAIRKIASEVQTLDRVGTARAIKHLEEQIDALHGRLAYVDYEIGEFARRNLARITLETEEFDPQDAAREVVENAAQYELIPDALGVESKFAPRFSDEDIARLKEARRDLGPDISYLDAFLPQLIEFPDSKALLEVHQDLSQFEKLKQGVEKGEVPSLVNSQQETLTLAQRLLHGIEKLRKLREDITHPQVPWTDALRRRLRCGEKGNLLEMLETLGAELQQAVEHRNAFLDRPVIVPAGIELDPALMGAVGNLSEGKKPFGLQGLFGKSEQKKLLESIRVLGTPPADAESWKHVLEYCGLLKCLCELSQRWNALASELSLETVPGDKPEDGLVAADGFRLYLKVKEMVTVEGQVERAASLVFPTWPHSREVADNEKNLSELEKALRHHLTKHRLANVWVNKERIQKVLKGRTGHVVDEIREFLAGTLGNPRVSDAELQAKWSALMAELSRVLGLSTHLSTVREICGKVTASGAPKYAEQLKQPLASTVETLLPVDWRKAWQLRRLATYLELIDAHEELKKLTKDRHAIEGDLSRVYRDVVVKRTWLKLAENASHSIRAALQAYLNAIQKIGKGTGKRAVRYRQDARTAASHANPAVPCWIMAHYRVSESLPAELGCFDLVVIDEASQSDLAALPSLLRAQKVLIVGDDKQVSPEGVGLDEQKVRSLMDRFLGNQVETYRSQMSPERSIYDLFKVVFAKSAVMLKEHFRSVAPIIEYSKREFYNHELRPLRLPKASERLDPP